MIEPDRCETMAQVRAGVDAVDDEIVRLLSRRFRFMGAAARIKQKREQVRDERRKAEVIDRAQAGAREGGISEELIAQLYDLLIEGSIAYELAEFDARRGA